MRLTWRTLLPFIWFLKCFYSFAAGSSIQTDTLELSGGLFLGYTCLGEKDVPNLDEFGNVRARFSLHLHRLAGKPLGMETSLASLAIMNRKGKLELSYPNILFLPLGLAIGYGLEARNPFLFWPSLILMAPQLLGNARIHLPFLHKRISIYLGQTTDYFLSHGDLGVYSATGIGTQLLIQNLMFTLEINRPWVNGDLNVASYGIALNLGYGGNANLINGKFATDKAIH